MTPPRRHSDVFTQDESGDFVVRRRLPPVWMLFLLFIACFSVLFLAGTYSEYLGGSLGMGLAIFSVIGPLTWYTIYFAQQNRDMLLATEFQNALFSAAARLKAKFCIITKQDGTIVYYDRGFQTVFPETTNRGMLMVDKIFNTRSIPASEAEKVQKALEENKAASIIVDMDAMDGTEDKQRVIITIDPLPRPRGFLIIRGREYVVKKYDRGEKSKENDVNDSAAAAPTFAHMLHMMPTGLYTTDADGHILFINYQLETWLGYEQNEVKSKNLTLYDLIPQRNTATVEQLLLSDCEGEIQLSNKQGNPLTLQIRQEITKDAKGNLLGSVAVLQKASTAAPSPGGAGGGDGQQENAPTPSLVAGKSF